MDILDILVFTLGLFTGNLITYRYINKASWKEALVFASIGAVLCCGLLYVVIECVL